MHDALQKDAPWHRLTILASLLPFLSGCYRHLSPDFHSPEPGARNEAIVKAASERDTGAVKDMVPLLDSDDAATRLLAIRTLERLTGETFGYDYTKPAAARRESVARWEDYVRRPESVRGR